MEYEEYKDMFGLYYRVKEIRPTYKLLLNRKTKKIELHDSNYRGVQLIFDMPITAQILSKINKTKMENSKSIFRKIEYENMQNQSKSIENAIYFAKNCLYNN